MGGGGDGLIESKSRGEISRKEGLIIKEMRAGGY